MMQIYHAYNSSEHVLHRLSYTMFLCYRFGNFSSTQLCLKENNADTFAQKHHTSQQQLTSHGFEPLPTPRKEDTLLTPPKVRAKDGFVKRTTQSKYQPQNIPKPSKALNPSKPKPPKNRPRSTSVRLFARPVPPLVVLPRGEAARPTVQVLSPVTEAAWSLEKRRGEKVYVDVGVWCRIIH